VPPDEPPADRPSLLLQIYALSQRMGELVGRELARDHVTPDDYALLSVVGWRGPVTPSEASVVLGIPATTASDAIRRLVARGHVRRSPHPTDGRSHTLELTAQGDREWRNGWPALRRANTAIARSLDADAGETRDALERLDRALRAALTES
jgi:DNA-binding MarR family transcriptional regulator